MKRFSELKELRDTSINLATQIIRLKGEINPEGVKDNVYAVADDVLRFMLRGDIGGKWSQDAKDPAEAYNDYTAGFALDRMNSLERAIDIIEARRPAIVETRYFFVEAEMVFMYTLGVKPPKIAKTDEAAGIDESFCCVLRAESFRLATEALKLRCSRHQFDTAIDIYAEAKLVFDYVSGATNG